MLRFLHLSDLHIGQARAKGSNSKYELCHVDFLNDCRAWLARQKDAKVDAILVTGDVAYAGEKQDYVEATEIFSDICDAVKTRKVYFVPGNHDVNRNHLSVPEYRKHQEIRALDENKTDSGFLDFLNGQNKPLLKLHDFNEFLTANQFTGLIQNAAKPAWYVDFSLTESWKIRVHGFCSVLISNDDDAEQSMVLGSNQWYSKHLAKENLDHLVLMHHPFEWLKDEKKAKTALMARMRLFLCGHTHAPSLSTIDDVVCIRAGALNPGASEDAPYSYNWIELNAVPGVKPLKVEYFPRKWTPENQTSKFSPDNGSPRFNPEYQAVRDWVISNYKNDFNALEERANETHTETICHAGVLDDKAKLLLLRPILFQAMRQLIDVSDIGAKGSAGQFIRHFKSKEIFPEAEVERLHDCLQILNTANRGAELSKREVDWALEQIPTLLSILQAKQATKSTS